MSQIITNAIAPKRDRQAHAAQVEFEQYLEQQAAEIAPERQIVLLTAPEAVILKENTYRYYVELVSFKLDYWGIPLNTLVLDVVVLEPTETAIRTLLEAAGYLMKDWYLVNFWVPEDEAPF